MVDSGSDCDHQNRSLAAPEQSELLDAADVAPESENPGAPRKIQRRPDADEPGGDEALQRLRDQSGRWLLADGDPNSHFLWLVHDVAPSSRAAGRAISLGAR